jgi:addiction module RelE/StbE family toxin
VKVVWTASAKRNLRTIHDYIAQTSPAYAKRMVDKLTNRSKQIGSFPLSGRIVPEFDVGQIREVLQSPYRIIYHIRPDQVDVVGVIHMSRRIQ